MRTTWAAPAALGLLAVVSGIVSLPVWTSTPASGATGASPHAPVLSLRRTPAFTAGLAGDLRLEAVLDGVLDRAGVASCLVVESSGRTVYLRDPERPLLPASNMKLLTALVALRRLGPDFRYHTEVVGPRPSGDGVVVGDLWLVGSGDPLLATGDYAAVAGYQRRPRQATSLEALADRVAAAGVRQIQGRVLGDESRYDRERYVPTWKSSYVADSEIGPASALTVNNGFVQWTPKLVPAPAPAMNGAGVLATLLQARGVSVGGAGEATAPAHQAVVATIESPTLSEIVSEMLRESDNATAESLIKELGVRYGHGGTTAGGLEVVRAELGALGLPAHQLTTVDGSGLDRSDRASCRLLIDALDAAGEGGPLDNALPVAGRDGTLANRFLGTAVAGRLRAKTGSLDGVAGLTGRVSAGQDRTLAFSLLLNGFAADATGRALEDRVAAALVAYPQAPSVDEIAVG